MTTITAADGAPIDLPPVEQLAGTNAGTRGVWRFASGEPGPHVVIAALMHGNEICGAMALAPLLAQAPRIARGTLTLVFCNLDAYARITDATKADCRQVDEDMNRVWGRVAGGDSTELRRAREILAVFETADVLIDLHSMTQPAPALGLVGQAHKNVGLARRLGFPALLVRDAGHEAGWRLIDRPQFVDAAAPHLAMLVECGEHFSHAACAAAAETVRRTLAVFLQGESAAPVAPQDLLEVTDRVTVESPGFAFARPWGNMELIPEAGTLVAHDAGREFRTPHPGAYMVMPATAKQIKVGQTAVRFARKVEGS